MTGTRDLVNVAVSTPWELYPTKWPVLVNVAQLVFLYRTHTDLVSHGFYLDKCIDLIEGFHAIHSFPYVELETRATEADKGPFLSILEGGLLMKMALFPFSLK